MEGVWLYSIISVFVVSLVSFVGIFSFSVKSERLNTFLIYIISFSAGALFGDAFIHMMPDIVKTQGFELKTAVYLLFGILVFFILEKIVHHQQYHSRDVKEKHGRVKPFAYVNLAGGSLHNFIDGVVIAAGYFASFPTGIATTIAVVLHEIPHEFGDFGILVHGGFSKNKALFVNFLTALFAIVGAVIALWVQSRVEGIMTILLPIAAGGMIYIAGSDLIPELHKDSKSSAVWQTVCFVLGIALMSLLLVIG